MKFKLSRVTTSLIAVAAVGLFAFIFGAGTSGKLFMNGSLSLKHEGLESDCSACHEPWEGIKKEACLKCHEGRKHFSEMKVSVSVHEGPKTENPGCPECHREHKGRSNNLKFTSVYKCSVCHLSGRHDATRRLQSSAQPVNDADLLFTHVKHIRYGAFKKDACEVCHKDLGEQAGYSTKGIYKEACGRCHFLRSHDSSTKVDDRCNLCHPRGRIQAPKKKNESLLKSFMYSHRKHVVFKCVDCHENLTMAGMGGGGSAIPERCVSCHRNNRINTSCVSCHQYHVHTET